MLTLKCPDISDNKSYRSLVQEEEADLNFAVL
jgi:hypothetical protein